MTEVCINGHTRTEENTRWHKRGRGDQLKRVCLECKTAKRERNGKPAAHELTAQRTTELHEDIADLVRFGATFEEIISRGGFSSWKLLKESLRLRGQVELLEQVQAKQAIMSNADLSVSKIAGNRYTASGFSSSRTTKARAKN